MKEIGLGGKKLISYLKENKKTELDLRKKIIAVKNNRRKAIEKVKLDFDDKICTLEIEANDLMKTRMDILRKYNYYADHIPKLILTEKQMRKDVEEFHSLKKIANKYNVSKECITNWLEKFGYRDKLNFKDFIENP